MRVLLLMFLWSQTAFAGLIMTLTPPAQPAASGAEVLFSGSLQNSSATERLFLNDVVFTPDPPNVTTLSGNAFFANVPGILLPGETYEGPLFRIALSNASSAANYTGSITFLGGADIFAGTQLVSAPLTVLATPVDQWRYQTFGDASAGPTAADSADWDHDSLSNLLEYALGLDALNPELSALPEPVLVNNYLTFSYVPGPSDVTCSVEFSTNLLEWGTVDVEPVIIANPIPPGRLTFRYKHPVTFSSRAFLRLKVTR